MTEKRFIVDDAGSLIDIRTRETYDYVSDVCELLNELHEEKQAIKNVLDELEKEYNNAVNLDETSRKVLMVIDRVRECWND